MSDRTQASIGVAAPPAAVLGVIADVAAYPQWANGITEAEVLESDGTGRPVRARFKLDAGPVRDDYEIAYIWNEHSVSWSLVRAEVLTAMDGVYTVEPDASGTGSDVGYELTVDLKMPMLGLIKRKAERAVVDTALKDLRRRVETDHG